MLDCCSAEDEQKRATLSVKFGADGYIKCCLVTYTVEEKDDKVDNVSIVCVKFDGKYKVQFPETIKFFKTNKSVLFGMINLEGEEKRVDKGNFSATQVKNIITEVANIGFTLIPGLEESAKKKLMSQLTDDKAFAKEAID